MLILGGIILCLIAWQQIIASTAAVPIAFLIAYLIIELFISWKGLSKYKRGFYLSLIITGTLSFIFRSKILDIIMPTQYAIHSGSSYVKTSIYNFINKQT